MASASLAAAGAVGRVAERPATAMAGIGFEGVSVAYKGTTVLHDFTLAVRPGEIMSLIGPSGSGKTTALRAVAGFVRPISGRVRIGEVDVTDLPPRARDIGMVVQNYALFPYMRVDENVAFGLRARRAEASLIRERVAACLDMVGMGSFAARYPRELSGGQQQRVAIARALAIRPRVLLLDEPLSALDAQIRRTMLGELARLHRELPDLTVLFVTHDQTEALTLGDSVAIMRDGRLVAHGASHMLYRQPPNRFAAEFLGRANLLPVRLAEHPGARASRVRFGETWLEAMTPPHPLPSPDCLLCVRPHELHLHPDPRRTNVIMATVREVEWQGDLDVITCDAADTIIRLVCTPLRTPPAPGAIIPLYFATDDATLIPNDPHV
jgi:2-aminoethylphosphonate transport system ATP-binding protein